VSEQTAAAPRPRAKAVRLVALGWGVIALLALAALADGPGISRQEAASLALAPAAPSSARSPLPALLPRAAEALALRARPDFPPLAGYRLGSVLSSALLAALVALLAGDLAGPLAAGLAPALLLCAPRLLLPLLQAGPRAPGAAALLVTLLAYRRATRERRPRTRAMAAALCGVSFGLGLAFELEAIQFLAVAALHAVLAPLLRALGPPPLSQEPRHLSRPALAALASMAVLGPAVALAAWPSLRTDTLHRLGQAIAALPGDLPLVHMGRLLEGARPPLGYPVAVTALALPAALAAAMVGGFLHGLGRLVRAPDGAVPADDLLLVAAAAMPFVAVQLGLWERGAGPGPWLPAFPVLASLAARTLVACGRAVLPSHAGLVTACLGVVTLAPSVAATAHVFPELSASWGELAGGAPGAASLGLARDEGEPAAELLRQVTARARPGARIHWGSVPPASLAVYAADGRLRPDLRIAPSPGEADLAVVPLADGSRQPEYQVWAALSTSVPVAGAFLDEVPLAWVYARPGAWR